MDHWVIRTRARKVDETAKGPQRIPQSTQREAYQVISASVGSESAYQKSISLWIIPDTLGPDILPTGPLMF